MKRIVAVITLSLLLFMYVCSVNIGSDTAVTRFNTQQTLNNGDRIAEFAALYAGFALADSGVTGRFDAVFQVLGNIDFRAGTLILDQDLVLFNNAAINTLGNIIGQGHNLEFNYSATVLPVVPPSEVACSIYLATQNLTGANKDINSLDWSVGDALLAVGMVTGGGNEVEIWQWNGVDTLTLLNGSGVNGRTVYSVRWHPTNSWLAVATVSGGGSELFIYSINMTTGAFTLLDSVNVGGDAVSLAWHPNGNHLALGCTTNGTEVRVYPVSGGGVLGTQVSFGTANIDVAFRNGINWDSTGSYLAVALGLSAGNPEVRILRFGTTPSLSLTQVASVNEAVAALAVDWHPTLTSVFAVGLNTAASVSSGIYNVDVNAGSTLLLNQISGISAATQAIEWNPAGGCLALGTATPNTDEFRVYGFNTTTFGTMFASGYDNGGNSVTAVRWSRTTNSLAVGGTDNVIYVYRKSFSLSDNPNDVNGTGILNRNFLWQDVGVVLHSDIVLNSYSILFKGNSYIEGNNHTIKMAPDSRIFVDKNSTLLMRNVTISGIQDNIVGAFDDLSTFSLENVEWILDGNYTFTKGRFDVIGDFVISGSGNAFAYKSQATSQIHDNANMVFEPGTIFSYEPVTANRDLIQLTTSNSELALEGATLRSTSTGIRLTTGKLVVSRHANIVSRGVNESEGISFGNGTQSGSNLNIEILPAAVLDVVSGCVVYNDA